MSIRRIAAFALAATSLLASAQEPRPDAFTWRATLDTAGHQGLMRMPLPAEALARLQSRDAGDLRVFDAQGQPVPFALATPPRPAAAPPQQTAAIRALPLHAAPAGSRAPKGTLQLRARQNGDRQSVWVQFGDAAAQQPPGTTPLPAALFDTRQLAADVGGFIVRAQLPPNVPVQFTLSTSADLAEWTPVPARGRIFRFDGEGAPANDRLELSAPLRLKDRYLRLDWSGQEGVRVESVVGLLAAAAPARELPALVLPAPAPDGASAVEWPLGFATPVSMLELGTPRANTLVPVRVLGRGQPPEPWRPLAQAVVYRLGPAGQESTNPAIALPAVSAGTLRVEATHGMRLEGVPLTLRVLFQPVDVVFAAGTAGPYRLVAGSAGVRASALPLGMLAATTATAVEALPAARIASVDLAAAPATGGPGWLPRGVDGKTAGLWLVLLLGVALLGGVAWSLLRQSGREAG